MTSDRHSLRGAGRKSEPAPTIPVYAICEVCGGPDERDAMHEGMCRRCVYLIRQGLRQQQMQPFQPIYWVVAAVMSLVASAIVWGLVR